MPHRNDWVEIAFADNAERNQYYSTAIRDRLSAAHPGHHVLGVKLGPTFGLRHCHHWNCVMSSCHSVERVDVTVRRTVQACY